MKKEMIDISDFVLAIQILTERIRVLADDLTQDYFGRDLNGKDDLWKVKCGYHSAGIKTEILDAMVVEADEKLAQLQESLKRA
ncbi:hypothetical protein FYJ53_14925 [Eubacterium sp. BL-380-WT-2B]|uniref:hypothetical protein n=1 Tax=Eubacterium sp. BL-380-WT-2B TaxID=2605785 RepID=UPI0012B3A074|nr:hypothetical protein [Eubacterium sp. BL-380-WT-2B]MSS95035.1 hypothetical protein [Eubacterium sp. BL-380-WT-2B]MSS95042.1 hypothetical protein [Eubacterium sp. BL-380-WT-2B]